MKQKYTQEGRGLEERLDYLQKEVRREVELLTACNPWLAQFKTPTGKVELTAELVQVLVKQITVYEKPASVRAVSSGNYGSLPGIGRV